MSTFITRYPTSGAGIRVAVKDLLDMAGEVTTAGCRALAATATPAASDAACLAGARAADARIVGRTNLHELALGVTGINPWYGTPRNPLDPHLAPGGSSSGAAVAVADGDADVGIGTDTGGSVRIPAACCGVVGLKTTWGRVSAEGVWPLAPSLDTIGPIGRTVSDVAVGMQLLEPGFETMTLDRPLTVGRLSLACDEDIDQALRMALAGTGWSVIDVAAGGWEEATRAAHTVLGYEAWQVDGALVLADPEGIGDDVRSRLLRARDLGDADLAVAREVRRRWSAELEWHFGRYDLLATPTLTVAVPPLERATDLLTVRATLPVNLAGVPAIVLPVPTRHGPPASLQLIAPHGGEALLLAAAAQVEASLA